MKKIISIALCAALLISMSAVSYSANSPTPPPTLSQAAQGTAKKPAKKGEALYPVTLPTVPAVDDEAYYKYVQEHQTPESFIRSMQKFGAKTAPMVLTEEKNQAYSPISYAYALGMLGSGTKGNTSKEIASALEAADMKSAVEGFTKFYEANYRTEEGNTLTLANSLWLSEKYPLKASFAKGAAKDFYASAYSVDFSKQSTADKMEKWISDNTGGLLNPTFSPDPMQVLSIINTLYFEGAWSDAFRAENNTKEKFTLSDGTEIDTVYMNQVFENASYYVTEDYTMFILPFTGGQEMRFALPNNEAALDSLLKQDILEQITAEPQETARKDAEVTLKLPKFSFDTAMNLTGTCEKLGLEELLDGTGDFSGITDLGVYVSDIMQESHVEIDENGCKAAAYTKMDIRAMAMLPQDTEKYTFSLDRPFLFTIQSQDDAPLFIGTVYNPTK